MWQTKAGNLGRGRGFGKIARRRGGNDEPRPGYRKEKAKVRLGLSIERLDSKEGKEEHVDSFAVKAIWVSKRDKTAVN